MEIFFPYLAKCTHQWSPTPLSTRGKKLLLGNKPSIFDISYYYHQNIHIDALLEERNINIPNYETSQNVQCRYKLYEQILF
jgi:hypothetical protein